MKHLSLSEKLNCKMWVHASSLQTAGMESTGGPQALIMLESLCSREGSLIREFPMLGRAWHLNEMDSGKELGATGVGFVLKALNGRVGIAGNREKEAVWVQ